MTIPPWNRQHVLPIFDVRLGGGASRNPTIHRSSIEEIIRRFAINEERAVVLIGFLDYREALYNVGIDNGFQWIDGSFAEHIEASESRSPSDIDVVTFYRPPESSGNEHLKLFDSDKTSLTYKVDAHGVTLGEPMTDVLVDYVAYWQHVWTHRLDGTQKGMVEVPLNPQDDPQARQNLDSLMGARGWI